MSGNDRERRREQRFREVAAKLTIGQRCKGRTQGTPNARGVTIFLRDVAHPGVLPRSEFAAGDEHLVHNTEMEVYVAGFDRAASIILLARQSPQQPQLDAAMTDSPVDDSAGQRDALTPLINALSRDRLEIFRLSEKDDDTILLARYLWDAEMAATLWPLVISVEVALRNDLHRAFVAAYLSGNEAAITASHQELDVEVPIDGKMYLIRKRDFWFIDPGVLPRLRRRQEGQKPKEYESVVKALRDVVEYRSKSKPITAGEMLHQLDFAFWTNLFVEKYRKNGIWERIADRVFLHLELDVRETRGQSIDAIRNRKGVLIYERLDSIRHFRNRVSHCEPLHVAGAGNPKHLLGPRDWLENHVILQRQRKELYEVLGWISPDLRAIAAMNDRFDSAYAEGKGVDVWRARIENFGLRMRTE